mmetsp:Transcript_29886/g.55564  ORF Transcript_29886/g.55564 Transcript_29886/m.55564 type:complete len:100 (+) Transcript_29886:967-1266(+)
MLVIPNVSFMVTGPGCFPDEVTFLIRMNTLWRSNCISTHLKVFSAYFKDKNAGPPCFGSVDKLRASEEHGICGSQRLVDWGKDVCERQYIYPCIFALVT